ncbi:MAG: ATP-binding protein [Coxiellaceae bacterium]|nr:ATP-binding protein [Coxiellaceae bacterium]
MFEKVISQQNPHWHSGSYLNLMQRNYLPDLIKTLNLKEMQILQGIRRSGKSSIFLLLINHLLQTEEAKTIFYVNLDDPFFEDLHNDPKLFYQLIDTAEKLTGTTIQYLFLDEVQNVEGWEKFVKSIYDAEKFRKIWITGSNSSLLNSDYAQLLTGRYFSKMIYPLSFNEMLLNREINDKITLEQRRSEALHLVDHMLYHGAFPRIYQMIDEDPSIIRELLLNYYNGIILKDCLASKSKDIRNVKLFQDLALYLINNNACNYSYNKLAKLFGGSDITYKEFIGVMQNAYLFKEINQFSHSLKTQVRTNKKIYTIDNGFVWSMSIKLSKDQGRLLENLVYTELVKAGSDEIYYAQDSGECDFITKQGNKLTAYQVCYQLTPENRQREFHGLQKAMEKWKIKQGFIITLQQEENNTNNNASVLPFWKWASKLH